jgi:tetratricopeptide (TPR) repeat protein
MQVVDPPSSNYCNDPNHPEHREEPVCKVGVDRDGAIHGPIPIFWPDPGDRARFEAELEELKARLPADPVQSYLALAAFFGERKQELFRAKALEGALSASGNNPDPQIALDLGDAFRAAGLHDLAVQAYQYVPQLVSNADAAHTVMLGQSLQNHARSLDALGRASEAEATFATARHVLLLAGRITR